MIVALSFLVTACSSAPPVQVPGHWDGWAEPAMETKTGIFIDLSQTDAKVTGTWKATKIVMGEGQEEKGSLEGTVKGDEVTLTFDKEPFDLDKSIPVTLSTQDGKQVLAGLVMHNGGIGTKYHFELKK